MNKYYDPLQANMRTDQLYEDGPFEFELGEFTVKLDFASGSSACFHLTDPKSKIELVNEEDDRDYTQNEDGTYLIVTSFTTETAVGQVVVHHPCLDWIRTRVRISIPRQWHSRDFLMTLRERMFEVLEIPIGDTWELMAIDVDDDDAVVFLTHED